jgi:3',5'-cyclic AMP phosphodiesterase CpdA
MVKALGKAISGLPEYKCEEALEVDENAALTFVAWGDPQISCLSPLRSKRVYAACRDLKAMSGKFDALLILGDIAEYGARCEYKMMAHLLEEVRSRFDCVLAIPGNHDIRLKRYKKQLSRFNDFAKSIGARGFEGSYFSTAEIKGYTFVLMGADKTKFESSYLSDNQLELLDNALEGAEKGKPVFVLNHQPLKNTHGLPDTWLGKGDRRGAVGGQSDKLKAVLEKHRNTVYITGHLHLGTGRYNYEDYGAFKAVSVPTVGVINHGDFDIPSQGLVFSVYEDKIVVRSRLFANGRYVQGGVPCSTFEIPVEKAD